MKKLNALIFIIGLATISCSPKANVSKDYSSAVHTSRYLGNYTISDKAFGTKVNVSITENTRTIITNALPNHVTGIFPNKNNPNTISPQNKTYKFPISPKFTGKPKFAREPGVALNGIKFEPQTAEVLVCQTGEEYRIEAIQDVVNLGLDNNLAHVQPQGAYHYHGISQSLIKAFDNKKDIILVGFAKDGFKIYYSKSNAYKPSYRLSQKKRTGSNCIYTNPMDKISIDIKNTIPDGTYISDWEYKAGLGDLDECNGAEVNGKYCYFITDDYPFISRCLMGEFRESHNRRNQGKPGGRPPRGRPGPPPTSGND